MRKPVCEKKRWSLDGPLDGAVRGLLVWAAAGPATIKPTSTAIVTATADNRVTDLALPQAQRAARGVKLPLVGAGCLVATAQHQQAGVQALKEGVGRPDARPPTEPVPLVVVTRAGSVIRCGNSVT